MNNEEILQKVQGLERQVSELEGDISTMNSDLVARINKVGKEVGNRDFLPPHQHKTDRISIKDLIGGFPVVNSTPTSVAEEGTFRIYESGSTHRLYIKVDQTWRWVALT